MSKTNVSLTTANGEDVMYGKIFESIYDGSLYGHWEAIVTMQQLIVLADADGVIDMTPPAIAGKTSIPIEILEKGLKILSEPDPHSRTPGSDGLRIQLLDDQRSWGWFLVNHEKYRDLRTAEDRREYMREYMRKRREEESVNNSVNNGKQSLARLANEEEEEDEDEKEDTSTTAPTVPAEFAEFKKAYPKRAGAQPWSRALKAIRARLNEGSQWEDFLEGARRYATYCDCINRTGTEYVQQAATFCGPEKHFLEPWDPPLKKSDIQRDKNIGAGQEFLESASGG